MVSLSAGKPPAATTTTAGLVKQLADVGAIGATTNIPAATASDAVGADTVSKADVAKLSTVNAAIAAIEARLDVIEAKVDAYRTEMRSKGTMA